MTSSPTILQFNADLRAAKTRLRRAFQAMKAMKAQSVLLNGQKVKLNRLPWYLVVGTSGSGKTTLLANSQIKYISKKKLETIQPTQEPDLWAMQNAVLFDVPGKYISSQKSATIATNQLWQYFLNKIEKYTKKQGLAGTIVTLSLSEIMDKQNRATLIETLENNLGELRTKFGNKTPFYFIITKCDLLPGFGEFFSDYGSNELEQAWGVPIPSNDTEKSLMDIFISRFNALISRLNKQLITRLYQERSPHAKFFIKDFPLQLEKFKIEFIEILKTLVAKWDDLNMKGVYLTSSTQEQNSGSTEENIQAFSSSELQNALVILQKPIMPRQTYFVKQFLLHGLPSLKQPSQLVSYLKKTLAYTLIAFFVLLSIYFYGNYLNYNLNKANQHLVFKPAQDGSIIIVNE